MAKKKPIPAEQEQSPDQVNAPMQDKKGNGETEISDASQDTAQEPFAADCEAMTVKIEELQTSLDQYKDQYQRLMAEFDNYKKRTVKEREGNRTDAKIEVLTKLLPVIDNIERAEKSFESDATVESLKQGVDMVFKQILDVMESEGVSSIPAEGEEFNPELHNAVMHIEDDTCDLNVIVEELQKGYICKDKVIRHSMVKVAN